MIKHKKGLRQHVKCEHTTKMINIKGRQKNEGVVLSLIGAYTPKEQALLKQLFGIAGIDGPKAPEDVAEFYSIPLNIVKKKEKNFLFYLFEDDRIKIHNERKKYLMSKLYEE